MSSESRDRVPSGSLSSRQHQPTTTPVIRPPVGFAWAGPSPFATSATPAPYAAHGSQQGTDASGAEPGKKKRSREGDKSKDRSKSRHTDRSQEPTSGGEAMHRHNAPMPSFSPSFRVRNYSNEPSPPGSSYYTPPRGYHQDYFSHNAPPNGNEALSSPRGQYYRHDYDRQRNSATSRHSHHRPPPPAQERTNQDHRAGAAYDYQEQPSPTLSSSESYHHASPQRSAVPPPPPPQPQHITPPSHSHRTSSHSRSDPQQYSYSTEPSPPARTESTTQRPLRILTLLIEDMRTGESQLAEIRVPLRPAVHPDDGFWADAQEVSDNLQAGPSRIDGPARVLTLRGRYKQIFLRVSAAGKSECAPASLKVAPERTMDVFVEFPQDLVAAAAKGIPSPMTYSAPPPSPPPVSAPQPTMPHPAAPIDPRRYDMEAVSHRSSSSRKRRRSNVTPQHYYADMEPLPPQQENESPPPSPRARSHHHPNPGSSSHGRQQPPEAPEGQVASSPSPSGSFSAGNSPEPHAPSLSEASPYSQAGSIPQVSPPPGYPMAASRQHIPSPQSGMASSRSDSTTLSNQPFGAPREQPPKKKARQTHDAMNVDDRHGAPSSNSGGPNALPRADSGSTAGPFAGWSHTSSATFTIPTSENKRVARETQRALAAPMTAPPPPTELDTAVSTHLRSLFKAETAWSDFVESRKQLLSVSQQMKQLQYVQSKIDRYVGKPVPENVEGAAGSTITKAQVVRAFNMPLVWGDECTEVLTLSKYYGPNGQRLEDAKAMAMFDEPAAISTMMQMRRYLSLLREIHNSWVSDHPEDGFVDASR